MARILADALLGKQRKKKKKKKKRRRKRGDGPPGDDDEEDSSGDASGSCFRLTGWLAIQAPVCGRRYRGVEELRSYIEEEESRETRLSDGALVRRAAHHLDQAAILDGQSGSSSVTAAVRIASYFSLMIRPYRNSTHPMAL